MADRHHAEGARLASNGPSDPAGADDADGQPAHPPHGQLVLGLQPATGTGRVEPVRQAAQGGEDQQDGVIGDLVGAVSRNVADRDPGPFCGLQVDTVEADGVGHETHAAAHPGHQPGVDPSSAAEHDVGGREQ